MGKGWFQVNYANMAWTGRGGSSSGGVWESFRGPDGRTVRVSLDPRDTLKDAQKKAYKQWKAEKV